MRTIYISVHDQKRLGGYEWYTELEFGKPIVFEELSTVHGKRIGFRYITKKWWQFWK